MIYAFECTKCGERFEMTESLADHERHKERCPKCKSGALERRFSAGVQVKTSRKS